MDDRQATDTDTRLSAYLNEHLLASEGGLSAFDAASRTWAGTQHEAPLKALRDEIGRDRRDLALIIQRLGFRPSKLKRLFTGLMRAGGEVNPINLLRIRGGSMAQFELDVLTGMVRAKLSMWRTLMEVSEHWERLDADLLQDLADRAGQQIAELERISIETCHERFVEESQ
ncbi:MAG: hypothetical protein ACTIJ7_06330 [Agrococcus casei]|uniref:hypothetical protein n=1 Tax=Agrococcus casei TaxID=343512 RepID=UPI003F99DBB8